MPELLPTARFRLQREQLLPRPIDEVYAYFADVRNLETITPPWLGFKILSPLPIAMGAGTRISYRIRWHGVPIRWLTEIRSWQPPCRFEDVQLQGPYRLWHHVHAFRAVDGGTMMTDQVDYELPLGFLGRCMHRCLVKADLKAIFDYRALKVAEALGPRPEC